MNLMSIIRKKIDIGTSSLLLLLLLRHHHPPPLLLHTSLTSAPALLTITITIICWDAQPLLHMSAVLLVTGGIHV